MERRQFLKVMGGGAIVAASAASAGFLMTRTPNRALAPWAEAGTMYAELRRRALSYAILAPNPHNRQPWLVDLAKPSEIHLYVDTDRLLPATDPFNRQITVGLGCFLELLRMAAAEDGYRASIEPFPEGFNDKRLDQRPIASVTFSEDSSVAPDPLFQHVLQRRSLKEPYDVTRPVEVAVLQELEAAASGVDEIGSTADSNDVTALRKLTREALLIEIETPHTFKESVDLFRIGKAEIEANPDGIDFSGAMFETLNAVGLFSREAALDTQSTAYSQGIDAQLAPCDTGMAYLWLTTDENNRLDQISAGRDWVRVNLAATAAGVGIHPMSQALQEYPEMADHFERIHQMLAPEGGTVQMFGRLGYADPVPPSPRWRLQHKILGS